MPHWKLVFQKGHFVNNLKTSMRNIEVFLIDRDTGKYECYCQNSVACI